MGKMINTIFTERLGSDSSKLLRAAESIRQVHQMVQQCEAGVPIDRHVLVRICFRFLGLMGFFPERVDGFPVKNIALFSGTHRYKLGFELDDSVKPDESTMGNGWSQGSELMGPFQITPLPTLNQIKTMFKEAFPKSSLTTVQDADGLYHVTVREKYLPADGAVSPTGAATCSNRRIAVIQAIVRLMHAIVQEKLATKQWVSKLSTMAYLYSGNSLTDRYRSAYPDIVKLMKETQDQLLKDQETPVNRYQQVVDEIVANWKKAGEARKQALKDQDEAMLKTPYRSAPFSARY